MSVFGGLVLPGDVEDDVTGLLKRWMPTYLREMERLTAPPDDTRTLPNIRTWGLAAAEERLPEQDTTPAVFVECAEEVLDEHASHYSATWALTVAIVTRSSSKYAHARKLAQTYSTAAAMILAQQHLPLGTVTLERVTVGLDTETTRRFIARGEVLGSVYVESVLETDAGPVTPAPDPSSPPPEYPLAERVDITVDGSTVTRP